MTLDGIQQIDGTKEGFTTENLTNGILYFIRTSEDKEEGYLWLNGKKYGTGKGTGSINCGEY